MRTVRVWLVVFLLAALAGCAQTGDFGRSRPFAGGMFAQNNARSGNGEIRPIETAEERDMKNRMARFTSAAYNPLWSLVFSRKLRSPAGKLPRIGAYYLSLRKENFASPQTRYTRIFTDAERDILTLPGIFFAICKVRQAERRREMAAKGIQQIAPGTLALQKARKLDNDQSISSFMAAISFRLNSYNFALEQLLVETPYKEARDVDAKLSELAVFVARGEAGTFCS